MSGSIIPLMKPTPSVSKPQRRVLRALQKLAMIVWRLLVHATLRSV